ncbi:mannonate dehydratase [Rhodoplanes sp. TEM]|uniref:mannonate dehydratase n=1 Tax=Rhodoplanes tepidamans TaxID=200616 RepID=A0ABT5J9N5_RHOTP|nr:MULTISPECIES: mannonate dehydratase [Rhodoplanes]MDC7786202.1 mannonate dehydratase [Rhodoplanes tepidamans]MDC7982427.1 mannonate dehydratase [Rhodoplanes sp. TEM]MDQ0355001.1 mannonate dehydratase [Rhodoplanes tepidamans]
MYIGEQLIEPTDARLRLSAQLGCRGIVIDTRPAREVIEEDGSWNAGRVAALRRRVEGFGMRLDGMALDVGSLLLDSLRHPERAKATTARLRQHIRAAAEGGVPMLKYTVAMVGITRTGVVEGRGGMQCSAFRAADYRPDADARFSYWGTVLPEDGAGGASPLDRKGAPETCGQVMASEAGAISEADGWRAIAFLVSELLPTAEQAGVRLACHPHDPAYPPGGLNGVHHVLGSLDGLRRFVALAPASPYHGFNFCQGTIAEMSTDPTATVLEAIRTFGPQKRIFMVHFRNIAGGYLDFREAMPDEGTVDMAACIRAYREVGYDGILCPDHVPLSDVDPGRERFFSFALGYTRGLLQAA